MYRICCKMKRLIGDRDCNINMNKMENNSSERDFEGYFMIKIFFLEYEDSERIKIYLSEIKKYNSCRI